MLGMLSPILEGGGPRAIIAIRAELARSNWLVFLKAHPWVTMAQYDFKSTVFYICVECCVRVPATWRKKYRAAVSVQYPCVTFAFFPSKV